MTTRRVPTNETSIHMPDLHMCGIRPKPSARKLNLRVDYHPGFGGVALFRDDELIWCPSSSESRTLGWIDRTLCAADGSYRLEVEGPMVSMTFTRKKRGYWVLSESRDGFA